jgi:hypothetical protein
VKQGRCQRFFLFLPTADLGRKTDQDPAVVYFALEALKHLKEGDPVKPEVELEPATVLPKATAGTVTSEATTAYEQDMEQRFPHTTKPNEDIPTKNKQVGS